MALNRQMSSPQRARQATFLGETEPRAARPLGASPRVRPLGFVRRAAVNANGKGDHLGDREAQERGSRAIPTTGSEILDFGNQVE